MSSSFAATVDLTARPSLRALRWVAGLHMLCLVLVMAAHPPPEAMLVLAAALAFSWVWTRRHAALGFGPRAIRRLVWHGDGGWTLHHANGHIIDAELRDDAIVRGGIMVLRFGTRDGRVETRLLLGDEAEHEPLRRLRARLSSAA